jgi:hypothetical protein
VPGRTKCLFRETDMLGQREGGMEREASAGRSRCRGRGSRAVALQGRRVPPAAAARRRSISLPHHVLRQGTALVIVRGVSCCIIYRELHGRALLQ